MTTMSARSVSVNRLMPRKFSMWRESMRTLGPVVSRGDRMGAATEEAHVAAARQSISRPGASDGDETRRRDSWRVALTRLVAALALGPCGVVLSRVIAIARNVGSCPLARLLVQAREGKRKQRDAR
jgi:hypothetical protein